MDEQFAKNEIELKQVEEAIRRSFRVPINSKDNCLISVGNESFLIADINLHGAAIFIDINFSFSKGQILSACNLSFGNKTIDELKCEVVRFSPASQTPMICGLKWFGIDSDQKKQIDIFCQTLKIKLLKAHELE